MTPPDPVAPALLDPAHVDALVATVEPDFHVVVEAIHRAIRERSSFNLIHEDASRWRGATRGLSIRWPGISADPSRYTS